jgi:hypothetical protein
MRQRALIAAALTRDHAPAFRAAFALVGVVLVVYTVIFILARERPQKA